MTSLFKICLYLLGFILSVLLDLSALTDFICYFQIFKIILHLFVYLFNFFFVKYANFCIGEGGLFKQ